MALLAAAALLAGVVALVGAVAGRTERVPRLWAGAEVGPVGAARVVEAIDYDFGSRQRHGIYRDIPGWRPATRSRSPRPPPRPSSR
jgi:hypothetical protein